MKIFDWFMGKVFCRLLGFTVDIDKKGNISFTVLSERGRKNLAEIFDKLSEKTKEIADTYKGDNNADTKKK